MIGSDPALPSHGVNTMLDACAGMPVRDLDVGDVLIAEGGRSGSMFVLRSGSFAVTRAGGALASISDAGAVLGEVSFLIGGDHGATVTATSPSSVYEVSDPGSFVADDVDRLYEIARVLARRLHRLTGYLSDVRSQYGQAGGHLGLLDEVLSELTFGEQPTVEPGSERDPDPLY